jgi:hypothetical protein
MVFYYCFGGANNVVGFFASNREAEAKGEGPVAGVLPFWKIDVCSGILGGFSTVAVGNLMPLTYAG